MLLVAYCWRETDQANYNMGRGSLEPPSFYPKPNMTRTITFKENPSKGSLGLEKEGRSKMPNCVDIIQPAKGLDGRWKTGLDEYAVSVTSIPDSKEREKKIKEIKQEREELERLLNQDLSGTSKFWETFFIEINPKVPLNLDIPLDRVKYRCILESDAVSPSKRESLDIKYKDAKYYVSREFEEVGDRVAKKKRYAEAVAELLKLMKSPDKAILIGKYLDLAVSNNMPQDNLFDTLQLYIDDDSKVNSVERFLAATQKTPEELSIKLLYSDAIQFRVIRYNEGLYQRGAITLGKNPDEVVAWLSNPTHSGELLSIQEEVELKRKFG